VLSLVWGSVQNTLYTNDKKPVRVRKWTRTRKTNEDQACNECVPCRLEYWKI